MALYCTHIVGNGECGKEIEGMNDPYCLKHMNEYKCSCGHKFLQHDDDGDGPCKKCDCEEYDMDE